MPVRSRSDGNVQLSSYSLHECARHRVDQAPSDQIRSAEVSVQNRWFKQKCTVFTSPKDDLCLDSGSVPAWCRYGSGRYTVAMLSVYAGGSSKTLITVTSASQAAKTRKTRDQQSRLGFSRIVQCTARSDSAAQANNP